MTIRSTAITVSAKLCGWLGVLVLVGIFTDAVPAYVIPFPSHAFLADMPDNAAIVGTGPWSITFRSDEPGFASMLYEHGARIVLPSGPKGCLCV